MWLVRTHRNATNLIAGALRTFQFVVGSCSAHAQLLNLPRSFHFITCHRVCMWSGAQRIRRNTLHLSHLHVNTHVYRLQGTPIKSIPQNILLITHRWIKLILQFSASVLNVYIDIYLPSLFVLSEIYFKLNAAT